MSNLDIKLAEARIRQARAVRGLVAGALGPALDGSAAISAAAFRYRLLRRPAAAALT